jgi:hypothetical protein
METLSLDTLYKVTDGRGDRIIEVIGGTVDIFMTLVEPTSSPITDDLNSKVTVANTEVKILDATPLYMYIAQSSGTTTSVRVSGIRAEAV